MGDRRNRSFVNMKKKKTVFLKNREKSEFGGRR